ncbi:alpha/beta fold hydrolase [Micromonospora olivasterospora]|uniref:Uncharacterized protein n=1 Tax=Micromonospora olivasterospora TaxID=1880 RepID=A0A562IIR9_MICOL|nr:alpha/beta hydrolase [Micromonospora olivasterospora]TWH70911.1 hypothetical protein JD77_05936 [Micromonospora olivasterospora]
MDRFTDSMEVQKTGIGADEVAEYARYLQDDAHLRASFEYFRALPQDIADNAEYAKTKLTMPVLALGARASLGDAVSQQAAHYAFNVIGGVVEDCGHWIFEERPAELTSQLLEFLQPA